MRPLRYVKTIKKNWGEKKFFAPPLRENGAQKRKKMQKITNFRPKMGKIWSKKEFTQIFLINPLKGGKTRNLAKNYNFPVIFSNL